MDGTRFDGLTKALAGRLSRRTAMRGAGGGLAAAFALNRLGVTAQEATPVTGENGTNPSYLFIQTAAGGTWAPKEGANGVYSLALTGTPDQTIAFSERPESIVGLVPTNDMIDMLGFTPGDLPNAALVIPGEDGAQNEILVIELSNAVHDGSANTTTYDATILTDYDEATLRYLAQKQRDDEIPGEFGVANLFIDSIFCPDTATIDCLVCDSGLNPTKIGDIGTQGVCAKSITWCGPCSNTSWLGMCQEKYPDADVVHADFPPYSHVPVCR